MLWREWQYELWTSEKSKTNLDPSGTQLSLIEHVNCVELQEPPEIIVSRIFSIQKFQN